MNCVLCWINSYSNALMVIITFIYVIATGFICYANLKSAKASSRQLTESQKQYYETRRFQVMPYLQFSFMNIEPEEALETYAIFNLKHDGTEYYELQSRLKLENVGVGIAHHTRIVAKTQYNENDGYPSYNMVLPPKSEKSQYIELRVEKQSNEKARKEDILVNLQFEDILGNQYQQEARFCVIVANNHAQLLRHIAMDSPKLIKENTGDSHA